MSNITCSNVTHLNITAQNVNCTNGSATESSMPTFTNDLYSSTAKIVAYSTVYSIVSIIALAGNFMVFLVMAMNRSMHTATNVLLLNLSLSDVLFVVFSVPGLLAMEICNGRWPFSETMGKMTQQTTILVAASSVFTMIAIAFERFLAVVFPLKQLGRKKKSTIALTMVIIWICAIAISIPLAIYTINFPVIAPIKRNGEVVFEEIVYLDSTMTPDQAKVYTLAIFIAINVIPIIALSILYSGIVYKLWHPDKRLTLEVSSHFKHERPSNFVEKTRRKTTVMLLTVVMVFFLCLFPYNLLGVLMTFYDIENFNIDTLRHANSILRVLLLVNSASNPIIYNFLSEKFRTGFRSIFTCNWRTLKRVSPSTDAETVLA